MSISYNIKKKVVMEIGEEQGEFREVRDDVNQLYTLKQV